MENTQKGMGPKIAAIVILVVLLALGAYLYQSKNSTAQPAAVSTAGDETAAQAPEEDTLTQIQADYSQIEAVDVSAHLDEVDTELK